MAERTKRGSGPGKMEDRAAETALQQSEARFRQLFRHIGSGVAVYEAVDDGADFVFRDFNPAAEKIENVRKQDILGRRVTDVFPGVKELGIFQVFQRVWRTGTSEHFPAHMYKDERDPGSWRENWIFRLPTGEIVAVYNDITERMQAEETLRESEENMRYIVKHDPNAIAVYDRELHYIAVSDRYLQDYDVKEENVIGKHHYEVFPEMPQRWKEVHQRCLAGAIERNDDDSFDRPDGSITYNRWECRPWRRLNGEIGGMITYTEVTTERKKAERALRESEKQYRELYEFLPIPVYEMDFEANITAANRAIFKAFRATEEDFKKGFNAWKLLSPQDVQKSRVNIQRLLKGEAIEGTEYVFTRLDGSTFPALIISSVIFDRGRPLGLRGAIIDITERKQTEDALQTALREKEILLREIHHRVKNNMQVISSLFNLQAGQITAENARRVLKEGQLRIRSMALVHEKLYQSRDLSKVDFADYLRSLAALLFHFYRVEAGRIRLETHLEPVYLSVNSAVPSGLLVNELVSNSLKHAFPADRKGTVEIGLRKDEDGRVELRVADDGVGLPGSLDFRRTESLGLQIVNLLADQLGGTIVLGDGNGTDVRISFREREERPKT